MRSNRWLFIAVAASLIPAISRAELKVPGVFGDNMVLQRSAMIPVWGTADPGEEIYVTFEQKTPDGRREEGKAAIADKDGKWMVKIGPYPSGGEPGVLTVKGPEKKNAPKGAKNAIVFKNVEIGEVWVCSGQSNMEFKLKGATDAEKNVAAANYPQIRLFQAPHKATPTPQTDVDAKWVECSPAAVKDFSAVAYFFGRNLFQDLKVPIGLIDTSYGGTPAEAWTSREGLLAVDSLKYYVEKLDADAAKYDPEKAKAALEEALTKWKAAADQAKKDNKKIPNKPTLQGRPGETSHSPSALYNAMIAPLIPFAIKGAIWYQGESNSGRAYEYRTLFPTMIQDWRAHWHEGDFPFLFVQLAPYFDGNSEGVRYAELRDAQLNTALTLKNTGIAVITDAGDEKDIHPKKKEPVGVRLALAARALAYGEKLEYSGPIFKSKKIEGSKVILTFDHVGNGLMVKGDKLTGFAVAGADGNFVDADAVIEGDTVVVSSPKVEKPTDVRFGWKNFTPLNFFNKDDLPASPFRTDETPYTTMPKK
jgi:sialate O-acetylesterase